MPPGFKPAAVLQAPDVGALGVRDHFGPDLGIVVAPVRVEMMRIKQRVLIKDDGVPAEDEPHRLRGHAMTEPAFLLGERAGQVALVGEEIFRAAIVTVKDLVAHAAEDAAPFAFAHARAWIAQALGERARENFPDVAGIEVPEERRVVVHAGDGPVRAVLGIEDEKRLGAVEFFHRGQVEAGDLALAPALERMVHHEDVEKDDRERIEIGADVGPRFLAHDLGRHEARGAEDIAEAFTIDRDVVVVADGNLARLGIEENVAEGNIAVAEAERVEPQEAVGQLQRHGCEGAEGGIDHAGHQLGHAAEARLAQRHQVTETGMALADGDVERPEEAVVRRSLVDQALERDTLAAGGAVGEIPLHGAILAVDDGVVDLALSTRADQVLDFATLACDFQPDGLPGLKGVHAGSGPSGSGVGWWSESRSALVRAASPTVISSPLPSREDCRSHSSSLSWTNPGPSVRR